MRVALASFLLLSLLTPLASAQEDVDDRFEDSVVRLSVSKQSFDVSVPWQAGDVSQQLHLGVVLDGNRILTTAFAVADATFIEMTRFGETARWEMQPRFVDWEANLALLTAVKSEAYQGLSPVSLGEDLKVNDKVDIFKARDTYQMSRMQASIQEVGSYTSGTSTYSLVSYLLKVQQTGLGWSEPIFQGGRLVALATGQDNNYVYAMPMAVIRHFLDDTHEEGKYRGFPSIGVELDSLVSPDVRKLIGAEAWQRGVRIAEVMADSSFAQKLEPDDVLLEVGGTPISEHGFFTHPKWGKLHLKYLLNERYAGDVLELKIVRKGKELTVSAPLTRFDSNRTKVVAYGYGRKEPHFIFGGLVFQELTRNYLKQWGRDWRSAAPFDLMYIYDYQNAPEAEPGRRIVLMSRVLADEFNRGYGDLRNVVVDEVNGRKIRSLEDMRAALRDAAITRGGKRYAKISFLRGGGEVILAYDGLEAAHERIAKTYEVTAPESFFR
jgi:hypothetical protein